MQIAWTQLNMEIQSLMGAQKKEKRIVWQP